VQWGDVPASPSWHYRNPVWTGSRKVEEMEKVEKVEEVDEVGE
jgi:hypothetical protein